MVDNFIIIGHDRGDVGNSLRGVEMFEFSVVKGLCRGLVGLHELKVRGTFAWAGLKGISFERQGICTC
jgi:hypothetical protein